MSDSGPRLRRRARVIAFLCPVVVLLLCSPVVVYDVAVYWRALSLIRILKTIEVEKTTGQEAVRIAKQFGGSASISERVVTKTTSAVSWRDVPLSTCVAGDCELTFHVDPGLLGFKSLRNLWLDHAGFRHWVPANYMGGHMEIKRGIVYELQAELGSIDEEVQHCARLHVYGEESLLTPWNRTPWRVRKVEAHVTGGPGRKTSEIRVEAWSSVPRDRILRMFDFNARCLWLGVHCSRCQILPRACEEYNHGDWYEFVMPEEALAKFRQAVNNLKLGSQEDLYDKLGNSDGFDTGRKLRDLARDRLPFDFPDGTIFGSSCPGGLTFYVKKWRLEWGAPEGPGDKSVTFLMGKDRRLQRIESRVEGIPSRP